MSILRRLPGIIIDGLISLLGGDIVAGVNSTTRGTLTLWDGSGGNKPGYIHVASTNGTEYYVFAGNDGKLRYHTAVPTSNTDGQPVDTAGEGAPVPAGTEANETLRWTGAAWEATGALYTDDTDAGTTGDLAVAGGDIVAGANSATRGTLTLWDGAGGNTPAYIHIASTNGTEYYVFVGNDGKLRYHTSVPTADTDGLPVDKPIPDGDATNDLLRWTGAAWQATGVLWTDGANAGTLGDLAVDGGDIVAGANSATRGTLTLWDGSGGNKPGYLRIAATNGTEYYVFIGNDGKLRYHTAVPTANTDGQPVDTIGAGTVPDGTDANDLLRWTGAAWAATGALYTDGTDAGTTGDLAVDGGDIVAGANSATRGTLTLWDGGGGNTPAYIHIAATNGTEYYLFIGNDGRLRYHNAAPTADTDGNPVGGSPIPDGTDANDLLRWTGAAWDDTGALWTDDTDAGATGDFEVDGELDVTGTFTVNSGLTEISDSDIIAGANSANRGTLTLWDGGGGIAPGYVHIGSTNGTEYYLFIGNDGTLRYHNAVPTADTDGNPVGGGAVWETIELTPGGAVLPAVNAAEYSLWVTTNQANLVPTLRFDKTTAETAQWGNIILPADYQAETTLRVYAAWTIRTGGGAGKTVNLEVRGVARGNDDAIDAAFGDPAELNDIWIADGDMHLTAVGTLTLAGTPQPLDIVTIKVTRDVANDDLGGDCDLLGIYLEYQTKKEVVE